MYKKFIKKILKLIGLYGLVILVVNKFMPFYFKVVANRWRKDGIRVVGSIAEAPHDSKMNMIDICRNNFCIGIFIETGTFKGDAIKYFLNRFIRIYSIELDYKLARDAQREFEKFSNVEVWQGDSGVVLGKLLANISQRCFFWLDGHYSHGITARGNSNTPIFKELDAILSHNIRNHIIYIDDARLFIGKNDYPKLEDLKYYVLRNNAKYRFEIENDVIKILPTDN
jgi:hypothetical protein